MQKASSDNKIREMMSSAIKDLNAMVDVNTIMGKPFNLSDGKTVIPVSKVTFGFLTGGGEYGEVKSYSDKASLPFSGGSGAVVSLKPSGFLIDDGDRVRLVSVSNSVYEKAIDSFEEFVKGLKNED